MGKLSNLRYRFGSVVFMSLLATAARADCGYFDFHCIAADAGRNAGLEAAKTLVNGLPEIGMKTMNYWGYLLEKYHAGTPDEKAWAKKIIVGELGIDPDAANLNKQFEIALTFTGIRTDKNNHIDVAIVEDASELTIKSGIETGVRDSLSDFRRVEANVAPPENGVDLEKIRALLKERIEKGPELAQTPCTFSTGFPKVVVNCKARDDAQKKLNAAFQADVLILALNPTTPRNSGAEVRFVWLLNPEITILIPKNELDKQPDLAVEVSVYRVKDDGTREPTRRFLNAHTLSHKDLTIGSTVYTSNKYVDGANQYYGRRMEIYSP